MEVNNDGVCLVPQNTQRAYLIIIFFAKGKGLFMLTILIHRIFLRKLKIKMSFLEPRGRRPEQTKL